MAEFKQDSPSFRVAVEGCGHGCLNDIYASVEKAVTLKGWESVDLVIIGGDFQAVRNSYDLACMAVPQKYKELGDFHEYYSGQRTAPYLTLFIGGNHEASNYLSELYYGGWVAPNIYYLGAANVIRCGPLRIASMSGIWKGYDYRKPHFERLPYNNDEIHSIFHVRELDIRKLLQIRTQVDVSLSHDWPRKVEYCGDYEALFRRKRGFREDSENEKLGNVAAKQVLDRLRPAYWFAGHLHAYFPAVVEHGEYAPRGRKNESAAENASVSSKPPYSFGLDGAAVGSMISGIIGRGVQDDVDAGRSQQSEATDAHAPEEQTAPEVRKMESKGETQLPSQESPVGIDAPRTESQGPVMQHIPPDGMGRLSAWNNFHQVTAVKEAAENARLLSEYHERQKDGAPLPETTYNLTWRKVDLDQESTDRKVSAIENLTDANDRDTRKRKRESGPVNVKNSDEIDLDLSSGSDEENAGVTITSATAAPSTIPSAVQAPTHVDHQHAQTQAPTHSGDHYAATQPEQTQSDDYVSSDLRSQLPASFARPEPAVHESEPVINDPLPDAISNRTTNFLALDKCLPGRDFLQLLELKTVSEQKDVLPDRPYRLQYDPEWLAITRVFAQDFAYGDPTAQIPRDKGGAFYKPLIIKEEEWIEENIVKCQKLDVPENFTPTAPFYDPAVPLNTQQMPPEYNNPQTVQFCELVGIRNHFFSTDEERQARIDAGPRPSDFHGRRGGGGGGRFPRHGGHGRHNRGGRRGRGRGRGQY